MKQIYIISALFVLGFTTTISAQDSIATKKNSESDRLKTIEKAISILPKISGLINVRYQYSTEAANYLTGKNGFDIRRVYLNAAGNVSKELSYKLQADLAGTPRILDAYVEWKPVSFIGLQAGQFKVPYTLENPYSPTTLETADNSQVITALVTDIDGNKNNGRDIGLSINGNLFAKTGFNLIEYKLGVFNGNAINVLDNNKSKDYVGSLLINPIKPVSVGVSYYVGEYGPEATKYKRNRTAFGVKYDDGKLLIRSEYLNGTTNPKDNEGYYLSLAYFLTNKLQPVLKYDFYQSDKANTNSPITNYVVGLNYWATPKVRVQANYTHKDFKDGAKTDTDYFVAQLLLAF
jgi:predicted porin